MKKKAVELEADFVAIERGSLWRAESLEKTLAIQVEDATMFGLITGNLDSMALNGLCLSMIYDRYKQDRSASRQMSQRFIQTLKQTLLLHVDAIALATRDRHQKKYGLGKSDPGFSRDSLFHPIHACLYAGDWESALTLATLVRERPLAQETAGSGLAALLLSHTLADDLKSFNQTMGGRNPFEKLGTAYNYYPALLLAVLERDDDAFATGYEIAYQAFKDRSRSRGHEVHATEYGYSRIFNALVLDFQCISACKIAYKRGMMLPPPNEYVPKEVVEAW